MIALEKIYRNVNIVKGTTTEAQLVQQKTKNGELQPFNQQTTSSLTNFRVGWWIRNDRVWKKAFPRAGSTEKDTCQPFVTNILKPFTQAIIPGTTIRIIPTRILTFGSGSPCSDIELTSTVNNRAFETVSFGSRKPDIVSYENGCTGVAGITFFGDVKRSGSGEFTDQEKGHILDMGFDLMNLQRSRPFLICFLTDGNRFQFFQINRKDELTYFSQYSAVFSGLVGWQVSYTNMHTYIHGALRSTSI